MLDILRDIVGYAIGIALIFGALVWLGMFAFFLLDLAFSPAMERLGIGGLGSFRKLRRASRIARIEDRNYDRDGYPLYGTYPHRYYWSPFDRVYPVDGPETWGKTGSGKVCVTRSVTRLDREIRPQADQDPRSEYGPVIFCDRAGVALTKLPRWCRRAEPADYWPARAPTTVPPAGPPSAMDELWPPDDYLFPLADW